MAELRPVALKLNVVGADRTHHHKIEFHPGTHISAAQEPLKRPCFFPVVSSATLAKTFVRKASGHVDGLVVESYSAGGHNAPPRSGGAYSERDLCPLEKIAELALPFWVAGSCASPARLREVQAMGAQGVQVGCVCAMVWSPPSAWGRFGATAGCHSWSRLVMTSAFWIGSSAVNPDFRRCRM